MQLSAQAQVAPGGPAANAAAAAAAAASLPPGLLAGHPAAAPAAAGAPPGLPSTLSLLASIPTSLAQQAAAAGAAAAANPAAAAAAANLPHPAFASLLAQQKPGSLQEAVAKAKEDELKRALETNGGELIRNCFEATEVGVVRKGFAVPAFIALCSRVLSTTHLALFCTRNALVVMEFSRGCHVDPPRPCLEGSEDERGSVQWKPRFDHAMKSNGDHHLHHLRVGEDRACLQVWPHSRCTRDSLQVELGEGTVAPSLAFLRRQRKEQQEQRNKAVLQSEQQPQSADAKRRKSSALSKGLIVEAYIFLLFSAYLSVLLFVAYYYEGDAREQFPLLFFPLELFLL